MPVIADPQPTDEIDVIAVDSGETPDVDAWRTVPGTVIGTWTGERVPEVVGLVAALPESERMRCFVPRYAIRLRRGPRVLAEVAFCFRCRNAVHIPVGGTTVPEWFTFDPDSEPAQDLLLRFRSCTG